MRRRQKVYPTCNRRTTGKENGSATGAMLAKIQVKDFTNLRRDNKAQIPEARQILEDKKICKAHTFKCIIVKYQKRRTVSKSIRRTNYLQRSNSYSEADFSAIAMKVRTQDTFEVIKKNITIIQDLYRRNIGERVITSRLSVEETLKNGIQAGKKMISGGMFKMQEVMKSEDIGKYMSKFK